MDVMLYVILLTAFQFTEKMKWDSFSDKIRYKQIKVDTTRLMLSITSHVGKHNMLF